MDILVDSLRAQPDLLPVFADEAGNLQGAVVSTGAHIVIVGQDQAHSCEGIDALLASRPRLKILAVSRSAKTAMFCEMRPYCLTLGELSASELLAAIRLVGDPATGTPHSAGRPRQV